ncbi:MAG: flagellar hook-associated protein 3 [Spirochaetes bacterium]|nr:flagellar hook-associated protein 3 [Spirochaetota bacterium]
MLRVTNGMMKDTMMYNLKNTSRRLDQVQNQISTGKKARLPHEDPSGVINSMLFKSRLTEIKQFKKNVQDSDSRLKIYDSSLKSIGEHLQRIRELAVQSSNGIFNSDDRKIIAKEIDQHLKQMIQFANGRYKGETIFSGFKVNEVPFKPIFEKVKGSPYALINKVEYQGDIGLQKREIDRMQYINVNQPGNRIFWGANMRVQSSTSATAYRAVKDQVFKIDGVRIQVKAGDTLPNIVQKINNSHLPIHASIDNTRGTNLILIESTDPHQIWLEDIEGGTVMQDLGLIALGSNIPPKNYAPTAKIYGGSIFDQIIDFRNNLLKNNLKDIGSKNLDHLSKAIKNISRYRGEIGALSMRLEIAAKRLFTDNVHITDILSKTEDIDLAEAMTNLKMLEFAKKAALSVGARIVPVTLMDFLR